MREDADMDWGDTLGGHDFFASWTDDELAALAEITQRRIYNIGEALWSTGVTGNEAFILLSGRIERSQMVRPDGLRTEQFSEPGDLLSLSSLVQPWEHTSSGTPLERSEVLVLTRADFMDLFESGHHAAYKLVDAIATNLVHEMRDANRRLHKVFGQPAETLRTLRRRLREDA